MTERKFIGLFYSAMKGYGDGPVTNVPLNQLLRMPEHCPRVEISIESPAYQKFLAANKALEQVRDEKGCLTNEVIMLYRTAIEELNSYALMQLRRANRG